MGLENSGLVEAYLHGQVPLGFYFEAAATVVLLLSTIGNAVLSGFDDWCTPSRASPTLSSVAQKRHGAVLQIFGRTLMA